MSEDPRIQQQQLQHPRQHHCRLPSINTSFRDTLSRWEDSTASPAGAADGYDPLDGIEDIEIREGCDLRPPPTTGTNFTSLLPPSAATTTS